MKDFIIVGLGSFLGGSSRYAISQAMKVLFGPSTPLGTLTVNIVGCFLIGLLSAWDTQSRWLTPSMRLVLVTGFCGGFTTFSTFTNESLLMLRTGQLLPLALYAGGSLVLGLCAAALGYKCM